jgi:hypothetical protein
MDEEKLAEFAHAASEILTVGFDYNDAWDAPEF